jgi:hypothetical protein
VAAMPMITIGVGVFLLVFGCRLFWLFVGTVGFVAGFQLAQTYVGGQPEWVLWAIGLAFGCLGAVLALFFQKLAIGLGGFAAGGYVAMYLSSLLGAAPLLWIYLAGGIIGAVLLYLLFDWALVFLSSVAGAALIVQSIHWVPRFQFLLYVILIIAGVAVQAVWLRKRALKEKHRSGSYSS